MLSDIEIAQQNEMEKIQVIADKCGLTPDDIEQYGHYKAKISFDAIRRLETKPDGKLVLVTAITPTPAGEGKSTTSIGLVQGLQKIGKNAIATLREPSLGPVFGIKGGAAGGGYAQVVPMDDINLHFTGDMHAITAANNLLSAMIDNHIHQGNELQIDLRQLSWTRVLDMNDRALRNVTVALGGKVCGFPREDHFMITVASEIMAILCLAKDLEILKEATYKATQEAPLRLNCVETFDEFNTGTNIGLTAPYIHWDIIPGRDDIEIFPYMAGGGCSLPGSGKTLMPGEGYEGVAKFVLDLMTSYGLNACPPLLVGVGIATTIDTAAGLSKKALMRPVSSKAPNEKAAYMEQLLEDGINKIGIGPQGMGGDKTVLGVNIEHGTRHPSVISCAVSVGCWNHRRGNLVFDKDGNCTVKSHKGVTL